MNEFFGNIWEVIAMKWHRTIIWCHRVRLEGLKSIGPSPDSFARMAHLEEKIAKRKRRILEIYASRPFPQPSE